ncbi:MAG: thiamine phosphate synthase [Rhodospirillaceae bacterium]
MTEPPACRLYLVTPPELDLGAFAPQLAEALDAGDVACVQLRLKAPGDAYKTAETDIIRRACDALRPLAQARGVAFIVNDRPDIAAETGCDGVHIGQKDVGYAEARRLVGKDAILGVTCHDSRHLAMVAGEQGADYVAFGAFYPTNTKPVLYQPTPEILDWWSGLMEIPSVAIGGITAENCAPLVRAGADFIAVVTAVWNHPDGPGAGVKALNRAIAEASA